jgi:hypothetical protein
LPIITIQGVPPATPSDKLEKLVADLQCIASGIPELGLSGADVSVFFPADLLSKGLGEEIIISINGLYDKPERTEEVLTTLAQRLGHRVKAFYFPEATVECVITPINAQRTWSSQSSQ